MMHPTAYEGQLAYVFDEGVTKSDRTGTGTRSVFGLQARYDLQESFPLITSKRVYWKGVVHELLWILKGDTNIKYLNDNDVTIWDEWADADGDLGPVYGKQWRSWDVTTVEPLGMGQWIQKGVIDQIKWVVDEIKVNPDSRRLIVSAWNPADLNKMALAPCHTLFQFYVHDGKLSCQLYQRSADMFLGVPFNIASYALLTCLIAKCTGLEPGEFIHTIGDAHLYLNHLDQAEEQIRRDPKPLPTLEITATHQYPWEYTFDEIKLHDYKPHPAIKAEVAV